MNKETEQRSRELDNILDMVYDVDMSNEEAIEEIERIITQEVERATKEKDNLRIKERTSEKRAVLKQEIKSLKEKVKELEEANENLQSANITFHEQEKELQQLKREKQEQIRIANQHQTAYKKLKEENERLKEDCEININHKEFRELAEEQLTKYKEVVEKIDELCDKNYNKGSIYPFLKGMISELTQLKTKDKTEEEKCALFMSDGTTSLNCKFCGKHESLH